ncbi:type II toxin-antitoxin system VapC family toxin [Microbacterium sp.]|uniref:type II toxin-antitoxin system VapC family toxin n=1 Tax=Microbacterium sp. TaxID=51671 RepID=UPI0039E5CFF8
MLSTDYYLDSSVALRALLGHSPHAAAWLEDTIADDRHTVVSSRIIRTEITRVLRREGLPVATRDELVDYLQLVPMDDGILAEAEAIVPHVKTLDAIHLAAAIRTGLDLVIVSHDAGMKAVAAIIGYDTFDPVEAD